MKIEEILKKLDNYIPVGDINNFPIEIVKKMVERQVEQGNEPYLFIFEKARYQRKLNKGFDWEITPEGRVFWQNVITDKKFDIFFEKYPKEEKKPQQDEVKYNPEFKIGDSVFDIIRGIKDVVVNISGSYDYPIVTRHYAYTSYGKGKSNDKNPILLHYSEGYDYNKIDFNNLPKRQEPKRWRALYNREFHYINFMFSIETMRDTSTSVDEHLHEIGNYFQNKKDAEIIAEKMKIYLNELTK